MTSEYSSSYKYDVFVSYRRRDRWPEWVSDTFIPLLTRYLNEELDWDVRITFDLDLEGSNVTWPYELAKRLEESAVLIPLWSRSYFRSHWCALEFSHMYERETYFELRTPDKPSGLICPAIVHDDKEGIPLELQTIQCVRLSEWTTCNLPPNSTDALLLEKAIRDWAPHLAKVIRGCPPAQNWPHDTGHRFIEKFHSDDNDNPQPRWTGQK